MIAARLALVLALLCGGGAAAQELPGAGGVPPEPEAEAPAEEAEAEAPPVEGPAGEPIAAFEDRTETFGPNLPDATARALGLTESDLTLWEGVASRAVQLAETGQGTAFSLERLRSELVLWRDRFLEASEVNAGRIRTVQSQIAALPPPAEGGSEAEEVTARRDALQAELDQLRAPRLLAEEARAEAAGLILEIDGVLREAESRRLFERRLSPIAPASWIAAAERLGSALETLGRDIVAPFRSEARRDRLLAALPGLLPLLLLGLALILLPRFWLRRILTRMARSERRGRDAGLMVLSLGFVVLPFLGVVLIVNGIASSGLAGLDLRAVLPAVTMAALVFLVGRWLSRHLFGTVVAAPPPLDFDETSRLRARRLTLGLGALLAISLLLDAVLSRTGSVDRPAPVVLPLLVHLTMAWLIYLLGRLFMAHGLSATARTPTPEEDAVPETAGFRRRMLGLTGRLSIAVAALALIGGLAGFIVLTATLVTAAVQTLALLAVMVALQRPIYSVYALLTGRDEAGEDLAPVLTNVALIAVALPLLALIWGARVEELSELWSRFRAGFAFGDTRISPTDFLTFATIFVLGYIVTRMVQAGLRSAILPRTRLDPGGQVALVSGVGYIGIFLAGLLAITTTGLDLSSLAIVAGALSVGIGFGLQTIVSNFISGIILLVERPISEGDWIEVNGQMGYVRDISVRATRIETFDRTDVIVPNADLVTGQVTNYTRGNSVGRVIVPVGVAYGTDTHKVAAVLREVAEGNPLVLLNPPPAVLFMGFGADSLDFEIRAILRDVNFVLQVRSEMNHAIAARFAEEGIEVPFAQRDIWLRNPEVLRPDPA